jgi:AcrR family transcriptional regulator
VTVEFLWNERPRPARGPKPALTLEQITDAGIAIADAEGLAAVTMQRVAAELGYTKMSLYRYLPGKAELVAAMLERGIGPAPDLSPPPSVAAAGGAAAEDAARDQGWRGALTRWAETLLRRYIGHGWAIEASTGPRAIGPNELAWMESALRVLPAGLSGSERMDAVATIAGHVRSIAGQKGGEQQLIAAMSLVLREHAERFPAVAAALADTTQPDQAFTFGLERILDGLEVLLQRRV